jgi:cysteine synthase A
MANIELIKSKIGNTPLVYIDTFGEARVFGKLESVNPTGSIKDRAAYNMLRRAFEQGLIVSGDTIVEPTSGNTGIGLAFVGREVGLKVVLTMPSSMSKERVEKLQQYGAEVILTDARLGMQGAVAKAQELAAKGAYMPAQFDNPANREIHYLTTAPEIFGALPSVDYIVSPLGSGGTAMGIKDFVLEQGFSTKVMAVEPEKSRVLLGEPAHAHKIQGIGANFVPSIVQIELLDGILHVSDEDAYFATKELMDKYGLYCGISSGAALVGAKQLAAYVKGDIVIILPDSGDRYRSAGVFDE